MSFSGQRNAFSLKIDTDDDKIESLRTTFLYEKLRADDSISPWPAIQESLDKKLKLHTQAIKKRKSFHGSPDERKVAKLNEEYKRKYLRRVTIEKLRDAFGNLDDSINLFLHVYGGLNRSNATCVRLWLYIMELRLLMQDSMAHLIDEPIFLMPRYEKFRLVQMEAVQLVYKTVGRATQFIVVYQKHNEAWRFHRKGFLTNLGNDIYHDLAVCCSNWYDIEVKLFVHDDIDRQAYQNEHLKQKEYIFNGVSREQPKCPIGQADNKLIKSLDDIVKAMRSNGHNSARMRERLTKYEANNFIHLQIHIALVEDIIITRMLTESAKDRLADDLEVFRNATHFIREKFSNKALLTNEGKAIWPHQKGIQQVGPFKLLSLYNASGYIELPQENSKANYKHSDKRTYKLTDEGLIEGLEFLLDREGCRTGRYEVTVNRKKRKNLRKALKIPEAATYYNYFHPMLAENKVAHEFQNTAQEGSPLHALLIYGGFGYFNKEGKLLQLNAFVPGNDIFFDGPYYLPSSMGFQYLRDIGNHLSPVGHQDYIDNKALQHTWIKGQQLKFFAYPSEKFLYPKSFVGAFVFKYDNSEDTMLDQQGKLGGRRNYFQLIDFKELEFHNVPNTNTPQLAELNYYIKKVITFWEPNLLDTEYALRPRTTRQESASV